MKFTWFRTVPFAFIPFGSLLSCVSMYLPPDNATKTKAEFATFKTQNLSGFTADAKQNYKGDMSGASAAVFKIPANSCAKVLFELADSAKYAEGTRQINFETKLENVPETFSFGPGIYGPGGVVTLGCWRKPTSATVTPKSFEGGAQIGTGEYRVHAYTKKASNEELAKADAQWVDYAQGQARVQAADKEKARKNQQSCDICKTQWNSCMASNNNFSLCTNGHRDCVFRQGNPKCETPVL